MNFSAKLINWYTVNKRDLPWRNTSNPYYIWLSEIILQQTQVIQGTPYYHAFTTNFPSVFDLANAKEDEVLKLWQGLGYYTRARNLHWSAKYIVEELNGEFPNTYKEILKLKGVGDYTASAIASICFNEVTAVVDGNVYRVLSRYFGIETPINSTQGQKQFKQLAQDLIDPNRPAIFNQAIMEFGARHCKPKNPDCNSCTFNQNCQALISNKVDVLPVKLKKTKVSIKYFNFIVVLANNSYTILEQRKGNGIWQNLYQFPLIETKAAVNEQEITKKINDLGVIPNNDFEISLYNTEDIIHKLSHQHLHTKFWIVTTQQSLKNAISTTKLHDFPVPILISNFIEKFDF